MLNTSFYASRRVFSSSLSSACRTQPSGSKQHFSSRTAPSSPFHIRYSLHSISVDKKKTAELAVSLSWFQTVDIVNDCSFTYISMADKSVCGFRKWLIVLCKCTRFYPIAKRFEELPSTPGKTRFLLYLRQAIKKKPDMGSAANSVCGHSMRSLACCLPVLIQIEAHMRRHH